MDTGGPAVLVVREHFVSIYWHDHIRSDNLEKELLDYAAKCQVSALGTAVYDDANFQIYAVCNAHRNDIQILKGQYMFDYDDIESVTAEDICTTLDTAFLKDALQKTLSCTDGQTMSETFEKETGLLTFMDADMCSDAGMKELCKWTHATVFSISQ